MAEPIVLNGVSAGMRGALGTIVVWRRGGDLTADTTAPTDEAARSEAKQRIAAAMQTVSARYTELAELQPEGDLKDVLVATAEMAEDPSLVESAEGYVDEGHPATHAVRLACAEVAELFASLGGYMAERVSDLNGVRDRVIAELLGVGMGGAELVDDSIVVAEDLTPADTAMLDVSKVRALVTELGGPTAHTAIIARQWGLACVVQVEGATALPEGAPALVDGAAGVVIANPDAEASEQVRKRNELLDSLDSDVNPAATADGQAVQLLTNIGGAADAEEAAQHACEGVGLFRTEVLFLSAKTAPTADEQAEVYRQVLRAQAGRKVVFRTIDAGADKPLAFANVDHEDNPALGVRGYRLVRTMPELLQTQLEAIARAAADVPETTVWVMAPMIATPDEARDFAAQARATGIKTVGAMVEVPSAALQAEHFLAELDFVSIGTNDLAQYTMGTDRLLGALADLIDPWQPGVLKLIEATAQAGQKLGKPVGVCGESAANPLMSLVLVGMGVTSLSMSSSALSVVRLALRHTDLTTCQQMARAALDARDPEAARQAVLALANDEVRFMVGG